MTTTIQPIRDHVLIKRSEAAKKTAGGIYLPDSGKEKPAEGVVKAVGKGRIMKDGTLRALSVKVGDKVAFSTYAGTDVKVNGEDYTILKEDDILGVIVASEGATKSAGKSAKAS
ncbi:MAG: co-chaperone GroES [Planctomycetota bacterium]